MLFSSSWLTRKFGPSAVPINYDTLVLSDKEFNALMALFELC